MDENHFFNSDDKFVAHDFFNEYEDHVTQNKNRPRKRGQPAIEEGSDEINMNYLGDVMDTLREEHDAFTSTEEDWVQMLRDPQDLMRDDIQERYLEQHNDEIADYYNTIFPVSDDRIKSLAELDIQNAKEEAAEAAAALALEEGNIGTDELKDAKFESDYVEDPVESVDEQETT